MVGVRNGGRGEGGKRRGAGEPFSPSTTPIFPRKKVEERVCGKKVAHCAKVNDGGALYIYHHVLTTLRKKGRNKFDIWCGGKGCGAV